MILPSTLKEDCQNRWNQVYKDSNVALLWETPEWVDTCKKELKKLLPELEQVKLLDYGCGRGSYFDTYKEAYKNLKIVGADIVDGKAIGIVKGADMRYGIALPDELHECDFDVIVCWSTIHHFDTGLIGRCISGFYDCLKPNGTLIVSGWGSEADRFKKKNGVSPTTGAKSCPIDNIKNLLELFFEVSEFSFTRTVEPKEPEGAFVCYKCIKKKLTLEEERKSRLVTYLYDLGADIPFFHLYRFKIDESMISGEMDRDNSEAYYRDEKYMCEKFGDFVRGLEKACGKNDHYFTKEIYSMKEKQHLFAFHDPGATLESKRVVQNGMYKFFDFEKTDSSSEKTVVDTTAIYRKKVAELYSDMSKEEATNPKDGQSNGKASYEEKFFYGLNQEYPFGVYFFVSAAEEQDGQEIGDGGLAVYTTRRLTEEEILVIDDFFFKWAATLTQQSFKKLIRVKAIRSAIGSIMSRNGSHNIGSHALVALAHDIATMPEDRSLYRYIQHRMDYIATATTEFPKWKQPTMFVTNILKEFIKQRKLLEYIGASEGLGVYDENLSMSQCGKIRILLPTSDVSVAIPGGILGHHAVFTILENIIRNAAKHEWSKMPAETKKKENLVIAVSFEDVSDNRIKVRVRNVMARDKELVKQSVNELNDGFKKGFLDNNNNLVRTHWGLAEMRISSGFLQCAGLETIGDSDKWENPQLIHAEMTDVNGNGTACLSYVFELDKAEVPNGDMLNHELCELLTRSTTLSIYLGEVGTPKSLHTDDDLVQFVKKHLARALLDEYRVKHPDNDLLKAIIEKGQVVELPNACSDCFGKAVEKINDSVLSEAWKDGEKTAIKYFDDFIKCSKTLTAARELMLDGVAGQSAALISNGDESFAWQTKNGEGPCLTIEILSKKPTSPDKEQICFWRHTDTSESVYDASYIEDLSGSQSYLGELFDSIAKMKKNKSLHQKDKLMMLLLVRCGIYEVRVFDERVRKFIVDHPKMRTVLANLRIEVGGEEEFSDFISNENRNTTECLIVHQGLIDKCTHKDDIYTELKKSAKHFVVTTGRGVLKLDGHEDIGVLPFPIIESTLMTRHPEKIVLIDAIIQVTKEKGNAK